MINQWHVELNDDGTVSLDRLVTDASEVRTREIVKASSMDTVLHTLRTEIERTLEAKK